MLSRINHKNFVNLIGYYEEDESFNRMMVFEYASNGTLFEHLHVKEMEHPDWSARMRIITGIAYCLQYMHRDLNPPVVHSNLNSHNIFLTDDYAAKIIEISFLPQDSSKSKSSGDNESAHSTLPPLADVETNVYCFGILLLEIISGKLQYSEEQRSLKKLAAEYLNDKCSISYLIDPTLKSFKNNELDLICEIIQECIQPDSRQTPTMKDITSKLREVIAISLDQATPRLSPLWWAELEILFVEAT
ncbi:protein MALE DISCOVERER 2-like [Hevea brasiliensis]|uniref:protein MALE DISCOVERER 2-like n=1 Tax=Hevea brasiliensis TaxID=3981 RepID=UPI0025CEEE57|nr:protein MALE DISCOVERER 2-like [Hevea brasiliensis]